MFTRSVPLDLGEDLDEFMDWAMTRGERERGGLEGRRVEGSE